MKFSSPSNVAAILCLFAASGSDAFAPSTSTSMTSTIRLKAGSDDLTSLLGEYSGSAYSSSPAVTKAVEKVAEKTVEKVAEVVVTVAPSTPVAPPVVVDAAPAIVDNFAAVNEAASAAQSAAEQAAAAAASLAAKSMPVIKAAATGAAAGGLSLKPLIGSVFVQVDSSKINPDLQFDASARAKENLAILKANFMAGLGGLGGAATSLNIPNFEGGNDGGGDMSLQAIVDSLHLQEYGGWYAAAAMAIVATQQKSSGKKEAASQFESELTQAQQKANEAAMAAGAAAAGAKLAKDLAMKMDQETRKDSGLALLESSKMKKIVLEKETMEQKIRELQTEVSKLNTQLEKAEEGKKKAVETVVAKTEIEEEYPTKVTLEGDPEEDARIIELLKMMDEENKAKKAKAAAEAEKKREEEAKYVKSQKNIDKKMTKGVEAAQAKAEVATKKTRATKKKSTATKAKAKTSTKKKTTSEKAAPKSETEASPVAAKEPEPVAANEPESDAANDGGDDWTQLAESALKRKTVKELTEYLTEKGVSVEKSMKKADLVEAVRSL